MFFVDLFFKSQRHCKMPWFWQRRDVQNVDHFSVKHGPSFFRFLQKSGVDPELSFYVWRVDGLMLGFQRWSKIRNTEVMAGEAGYGPVWRCFFVYLAMAPLGYVLFKSICSGEWGWEESPCSALSCYDLEQWPVHPEPTRISHRGCHVRVLFTLLPCQGAAAAAMWAAWGKGGAGDGEDARGRWDLLGEGKMWPEKQYKQQSSGLGYTITTLNPTPQKNTIQYLKIMKFRRWLRWYPSIRSSSRWIRSRSRIRECADWHREELQCCEGLWVGASQIRTGKVVGKLRLSKNGMDGYHVSIGIPRMDPGNF